MMTWELVDKGPSLKNKLDREVNHIMLTEAAGRQVLETDRAKVKALEQELAAVTGSELSLVAKLLRLKMATIEGCKFVGGMYLDADEPYPDDVTCSVHFTKVVAKFRKKAGILSLRIQTEFHDDPDDVKELMAVA